MEGEVLDVARLLVAKLLLVCSATFFALGMFYGEWLAKRQA
jgi:hypothetical protein